MSKCAPFGKFLSEEDFFVTPCAAASPSSFTKPGIDEPYALWDERALLVSWHCDLWLTLVVPAHFSCIDFFSLSVSKI